MKIISMLALATALGAATIVAAQPSGGPDAKGNAPLKAVHTVNDGVAKPGANSFTQSQARKHILNSGYTAVSGLAKGPDGVWRGTATKDGAAVSVALDFKGNVSEGGPAPGAQPAAVGPVISPAQAPMAAPAAPAAPTSTTSPLTRHGRHHHRRRHHHASTASAPGRSGVAMSGIDRNRNGVSDKEDRANDKIPHP